MLAGWKRTLALAGQRSVDSCCHQAVARGPEPARAAEEDEQFPFGPGVRQCSIYSMSQRGAAEGACCTTHAGIQFTPVPVLACTP
jgi:hypothetical protein